MRVLLVAAALAGLSIPRAFAEAPLPSPQEAKPLSELLQSVEHTPWFHYIDEVDWEHGVY